MRGSAWTTAVAGVAVLTLGVAACGGSGGGGGGSSSSAEQAITKGAPVSGKRGGTLTALWTDDVDHIDCGETYYQMGVYVCSATQKYLYYYKPDNGTKIVPDLAESLPQVSDGGRTVTVKIKSGVKFSPPVNREVTSKDVKYAIERGFYNTVNNGYAGAYFGDIIGAKAGAKPGTQLQGIETPDAQTVVFKLKRPTGGVLAAGALAMGLTAPVPEEYARKLDAENPSSYGENQVATGPYMIKNNAQGHAIGYVPGKQINLVRNPNWDRSKDFRPAYLDAINMPQGNDDTTVAARKILSGKSMISGDFNTPPEMIKQALTRYKGQLALPPGGGAYWIAMNMSQKPFDNINVRKAVVAGFDRKALLLARGGKTVGTVQTHFLAPGMAGFEEAGGFKGAGYDWLNTTGQPNMQVAAKYFKKAGYSSGKYTGGGELLMVGTSEGVAQKVAEIAKQNFEKMGFKVRLRLVTQDAMYTKYCNVPSAKVDVCPNVGWLKDFSDGQTMLDPTFNGENILAQGNSNWSQLNDPKINAEMDKAKVLTSPQARAAAWAKADRAVTAQAPAIPYIWNKQPEVQSSNVNGVIDLNNAQWYLAYTSLK